jgi:hypothetical protein
MATENAEIMGVVVIHTRNGTHLGSIDFDVLP